MHVCRCVLAVFLLAFILVSLVLGTQPEKPVFQIGYPPIRKNLVFHSDMTVLESITFAACCAEYERCVVGVSTDAEYPHAQRVTAVFAKVRNSMYWDKIHVQNIPCIELLPTERVRLAVR